MTPYRRLLCPTDFSDLSIASIGWSLDLAKALEADLTVLHVVDTTMTKVGNLVAVPNATHELRSAVESNIENLSSLTELPRSRFVIDEGAPVEGILRATTSWDYDLLVMGTHGHSGFTRLMLGSVTEKILHRVRIPLLVATSANECAGSSTRTGDHWPPKAILLAVDFGPETPAVVRHGVWLAEHFGARLIATHTIQIPYMVLNERTLTRMSAAQLERLEDSLGAESRSQLLSVLPDQVSVPMELATPIGSSSFDGLREGIRAHGVDLIVMGAGGHGAGEVKWLGSTCHKVVRSGLCPVLIAR